VAINERILAALPRDWRSPKAVDAEQWHSAALEPIASEAEQLLKSRLEQYPQRGCKDPRLGRPVGNLLRRMRGYGKEAEPVAAFEVDALHTILTIRQSLSWELTAPLRLIHRVLPHRRPVLTRGDPIALTAESHPLPPPTITVGGPPRMSLRTAVLWHPRRSFR
jgi:hypothetical protein